jgi:hypothetical protein
MHTEKVGIQHFITIEPFSTIVTFNFGPIQVALNGPTGNHSDHFIAYEGNRFVAIVIAWVCGKYKIQLRHVGLPFGMVMVGQKATLGFRYGKVIKQTWLYFDCIYFECICPIRVGVNYIYGHCICRFIAVGTVSEFVGHNKLPNWFISAGRKYRLGGPKTRGVGGFH